LNEGKQTSGKGEKMDNKQEEALRKTKNEVG
jgi:hypothetical protein